MVASTRTDRPLDLNLLATRLLPNTYKPSVFCGLVYRRTNPKATITLFATGKITSTGSISENAAHESIRITLAEINSHMNQDMTLESIATHNIVATSDLGFRVDLEKLARAQSDL